MTPVTGSITDTYEDRFVFGPGPFQRFVPPGIPVYRIMGMLKQVRTRFMDQMVGMCSHKLEPDCKVQALFTVIKRYLETV
jgi:hypothetical protein